MLFFFVIFVLVLVLVVVSIVGVVGVVDVVAAVFTSAIYTVGGAAITSSIPVVQVNATYPMTGMEESNGTKEPANLVGGFIACSDRPGTDNSPRWCVDSWWFLWKLHRHPGNSFGE